jgi:hypothetical protein
MGWILKCSSADLLRSVKGPIPRAGELVSAIIDKEQRHFRVTEVRHIAAPNVNTVNTILQSFAEVLCVEIL